VIDIEEESFSDSVGPSSRKEDRERKGGFTYLPLLCCLLSLGTLLMAAVMDKWL